VARTRTRSELLAISGEAPSTANASWPNGYARRMRVTRSTANFANLVTSLALELEPQGVRVGTDTVCSFIELEHHQPGAHRREFSAMSKEKPGCV
jgi:hypothetical protein